MHTCRRSPNKRPYIAHLHMRNRHEHVHMCLCTCTTARCAGRRGSVAQEELDKAGGGAASPQKGRYTRRRSSAASESIQEAASKLSVK